MAKEIAFKITVDTEVGELSVGELKQGFKQLQNELKGVNEGTEEYRKRLLKLAEVKGQLNDLRDKINALDPEKRFKAFATLGSSIASGFAAAQGAMALFGSESEDLQKVLVRIQAAMALAQGLQGLVGFSKALDTAALSMKAFALANPFTAVALGVAALAAGITAMYLEYKRANSEVGKMEVAIERLNKVYSHQQFLLNEQLRILQAQKGSEEEILKKKKEIIEVGVKEASLTLFLAEAKRKQAIEEESLSDILTKAFSPALAAARRLQRVKEANEEIRIAKEKLETLKNDLIINATDVNNFKEGQAEKAKKLLDDLAPDNLLSDPDKDPLLIIPEKAKDMGEEVIDAFSMMSTIAGQTSKEFWAEQNKNAEEALAYQKALAAAQIALEQAKWNGLITLSNIGQQLAGKNRVLADTFFAIEKGLAIAQIVVSTQKEVAGYWANPTWKLSPDGGVGLATAASLAAKLRAATSIATIIATSVQRFMGGGGGNISTGGGGFSAPNTGTPNIQSPQSQQNFQTSQTQVNQTSQGNFAGFGQIKAYVVENEITDTQSRIQSIKERTTY